MDRIIIAYKDLSGQYKTEDIFTDIPVGSVVDFDVTYDKVLIADGTNPCRFIQVDKDNQVQSGEIGIDAPQNILKQDTTETANPKTDWDSADSGMGVEYGNIIQYAHTAEDKYGSESNPSPITTLDAIITRYPDGDSDVGFSYYWLKTIISNLDCSQYSKAQKDRLKWWNIYRRDIPFREGVIGTQFQKVYRKEIDVNAISQSYEDSSGQQLGDIAYDKGKSPSSELVKTAGNVVFLGAIAGDVQMFPFQFDRYIEINITNDNATDYVNAVVAMVWDGVELGVDDWRPYLEEPKFIRLFASDLTTPCPVMYKLDGYTLYVYVKVPVLNRESVNKLYLCLGADDKYVTNPKWDDYEYGKFYDFTQYAFGSQPIFDPIYVRNREQIISTNVNSATQDTATVANWADMNMDSHTYTSGNVLSTWTQSSKGLKSIIYGEEQQIGQYAYDIIGKYNKFPLASELSDKKLIVFSGVINMHAQTLFSITTDNPKLEFRIVGNDLFLTLDGGSLMSYTGLLYNLPSLEIDVRIVFYITDKRKGSYYIWTKDSLGVIRKVNGFVDWSVDVIPDSNITANDCYLQKFEVYDHVDLTPEQFINNAPSYLYNTPIFRQPVGARPHIEIGQWTNDNITFAKKTFEADTLKNRVVWSDVNGQYFNALSFKSFKEKVNGIVEAPSFLKMQYQNTLVIFTRNTVSRLPLSDDLSTMAGRSDNLVSEYQSGGLYAQNSVLVVSDAIFWFSENGVMMWTANGMQNISANIIDIPLSTDYIGLYIPSRNQYWLHDNTTHTTYVYHITNNKWTQFSGLNIKGYANLTGGADTDCKSMFLQDNDVFSTYPSTQYDDVDYTLTTKQYVLDNSRPIRYRVKWDNQTTSSIRATVYNEKLGGDATQETVNPSRFDWIYLPNGMWGEYIQFEFTDTEALTRIDIDIKDGV